MSSSSRRAVSGKRTAISSAIIRGAIASSVIVVPKESNRSISRPAATSPTTLPAIAVMLMMGSDALGGTVAEGVRAVEELLRWTSPAVPTRTLFHGVLPFMVADVVRLGILIAFPAISLWLPSLMR